ncbi:Protein of unknown function [Cotesia congregata]|uniref:Endonuclease/exonuclease/phosphatase domain-containing protein n=1 Tax=Cotesia congregata TaxID=51543 RepID=A0A8J2MSP5_COTCN|nr:Protein of unknown function [Cotesia congregata]
MDVEGAKQVTPTRHTCAHCKQTNLRSANQCSGCGQLFHKACLLKNHKYTNERGEQIECVGHEISDNVSVASSVSSVTRKKRKRYDEEIDVSDIADKVDTLIDRVQEIGVNVEDFRYEIKNIAMQIFLDIKDDSMKTVREIVREEVQNVIGGSNDCKTEEVKSFKKLATYADRAKGSKTETVVIEPKEKQDNIFEKWLFTVKPDVICLTETHIGPDVFDHEIEFKNYSHVRTNTRNNRTGGILLNSTEISDKTWINVVQIGGSDGFVIVNVYRSPKNRVSEFKENMVELLENYVDKGKLITVGDFNLDVGSDKDRYARNFVNECALLGLKQLVKVPTRSTLTSDTIIDLVFSNVELYIDVLSTPRVSDHNIIVINSDLNIEQNKNLGVIEKRNFNKFDPNIFCDIFAERYKIDINDDIDVVINKFNSSITYALHYNDS